ncbi:putative glucan endo-1,3-alpha-glucosidase agn1 precursor [Macrophomina phaseolina]|uniref:Glucan endo-1,3-alpha-glucosidase agn1 n=1 Tax=Macrophomina phaseolina TaxID=35725 RepID=A0ABQ8G986_9PEZI|nr:putative glucan endo-1,3-alpha-glucosidase agn1 precursor [Macrophomina phaseolina]
MKLSTIFATLAALAGEATAKAVFAHFMVGNVINNYDVDKWTSDIKLAQASGIDGFVLNITPPLNEALRTQIAAAFIAANNLKSEWKNFFSFDYLGNGIPWNAADIASLMKEYGPNYAYQKASRNGVSLPFVSTFEGGNHAGDWASIKSQVDVYLVPDWTGSGADVVKANINAGASIDGFFSWDMWPEGANDMSTTPDKSWQSTIGDKDYMMGVSPWFFTDLKGYGKQRLWRGDDLWADRWEQVQQVNPEWVEIVTWNDYGESHYIGPIWEAGIPQDASANADARWYVEGYGHQHWRDLLPYYIARYKNGSPPAVTQEKLTWWYRLSPKAAGTTQVTGNDCSYQPCLDPNAIVQDEIFFTALISDPANTNIVVQVGDNTPVSHPATAVGINHFSQPFNGQYGNVTFSIVRNGRGVLSGTGYAITAQPPNGKRNYNAYVGGVPDTYASL